MSYSRIVKLLALSLSLTTAAQAQRVLHLRLDGAEKELIVFTKGYKPDSTCKHTDNTSTKKISKDAPADFNTQLTALAMAGIAKGGNIIVLNRVEDSRQSNHYRFWGDIYNTTTYDALKSKVTEKEQKRSKEPWALVTVYRPAYSGGFNDDSIAYDLIINDTLLLPMKAGGQCVLKVTKEGKLRLTTKHKDFIQNTDLDVKHGSNYYVRNYTNFPGSGKYVKAGDMQLRVRGYTPYLDIVTEQQGYLESAMLKGMTIMKRVD